MVLFVFGTCIYQDFTLGRCSSTKNVLIEWCLETVSCYMEKTLYTTVGSRGYLFMGACLNCN